MTSKHCFFKIMKEDFRHKLWMLALSILGNMLAIPVTYLLATGDSYGYYAENGFEWDIYSRTRQVYSIHEYFATYMLVFAAVVAITGALIVGLAGFRYLFHKNMVDTYHSIPVKRKTLFAANWLNGFLIWFVPFVVMYAFTTILGEIRLGTLREELTAIPNFSQFLDKADSEKILELLPAGGIALKSLRNGAALVIVFLLVYNLCLVAVMLCGNVLNTLVFAAIMGVGVVAVYGIGTVFCMYYFRTYIESLYLALPKLVYASPLVSVIYFLVQCGLYASGEAGSLLVPFLVNGMVALGLLAAAFVLYLRRPSELSEQGMKWKPVRYIVQGGVTLGATMGGWLVFSFIAEEASKGRTGWGVFGALLAGIIVFGVMDIITSMEFKAFFRHKLYMAATMAAGLLLCFAFQQDWFGYESYLPKEGQIEEIAIFMEQVDNIQYYNHDFTDKDHPLQKMHIRDTDTAYELLKAMTANTKETDTDRYFSGENVYTKVTLKNGKVYYRRYVACDTERELLYRLVNTKDYLDVQYRIPETEVGKDTVVRVSREGRGERVEKTGFAAAVCEAYNRDLEEVPEVIIKAEGRLFCTLAVERRELRVYEEMTNTRETLRAYGLQEYADPMKAEEVQEILLHFTWYGEEEDSPELVIQKAREFYYSQEQQIREEAAAAEEEYWSTVDYDLDWDKIPENNNLYHYCSVKITNPQEIQELLNLVSYDYEGYNMFRVDRVYGISVLMKEPDAEGETVKYDLSMMMDTLPEKYILRFGEQWEEVTEK